MKINSTSTHSHEFHFVMDRVMKDNLKGLDIYKATESFSDVVLKILVLLGPVLKREHKRGKQRNSRYLRVSRDLDKNLVHVHVYIPENIYRHLKLMHQDLNFYSIAQLVRYFLDFFLCLVKKYGNDVYNRLKKIFMQWNKKEKKYQLTLAKVVRHLWMILRHLPEKGKLINIYNEQFSPFWIFYL